MTRTFRLDPQRSRFTAQAFATGMLSGFAHSPTFAVKKYQGPIGVGPEPSDANSLSIAVETSSLILLDALKEGDRQEIEKRLREEVLEITKFPQITFTSTAIALSRIADNWFRVQITGEMKLHGMSKPMAIDSQLRLTENEARLSGEFQLSLTAFNIKRVSAVGGMIKVKDEVKIVFDLIGVL